MSVPADVMSRLQQQQPKGGAPLPGGGQAGPNAAPMANPEKKSGNREMARVHVHIAMNMLEQALPVFGAESKEGKSILTTLNSLAKNFGERDASDLVPAEMLEMVRGMPQMGGGNQQQQAIAKLMAQKGGPPGAGMPRPPQPPAPM